MKKILFLAFVLAFVSCKTKQPVLYNDPIPAHDEIKIQSKHVNEERVINIWTPPNYENSDVDYPVLYMPDGGTKEDFPHIANTLDTLIKQGKIPPHILVGIENTERRRDLTGPTEVKYDLKYIKNPGGSANFRSFIKKEIVPTINQKYRTTQERALVGESLAGLFVVETFILEPEMFNTYICMDPSLWFNDQYLVKEYQSLTKNNNYTSTKIWFAGSGAKDINKYTKMLHEKMLESPNSLSMRYVDKPNEKHSTIFRASKEEAFIWALNQ